MRLKELLTDDNAVSPVIGVILMVAITVILAAVIATFVLGLGEQVSDTAPNANFQFEQNSTAPNNVTVTHTSGPAIEAGQLSIGGPGFDNSSISDFTDFSGVSDGDEISAGDSIEIYGDDLTSSERISVIWNSNEGDSATLANYDVP